MSMSWKTRDCQRCGKSFRTQKFLLCQPCQSWIAQNGLPDTSDYAVLAEDLADAQEDLKAAREEIELLRKQIAASKPQYPLSAPWSPPQLYKKTVPRDIPYYTPGYTGY